MNKSGKRLAAFLLTFVLALGIFAPQHVSASTVRLNRSSLELYTGYTAALTLKNAEDIKWSTTDKAVAKVSAKGVVTAVDEGSCSIRAYDKDTKKTYTCSVKVKRKSLTLDASMGTVTKSGIVFSLATLKNYIKSELGDAIGSDVQWSSSDGAVVSVTEDMGLCAQEYGSVTLTADMRGRTYIYNLSVIEAKETAEAKKTAGRLFKKK